MPQQLFHNMSNLFSTAFFKEDVIRNNTLNPVRLTVGARCYRIQSRLLRIPDRYGIFSPGPPRLQVYQAGRFMVLFFSLWYLNAVVWLPMVILLAFFGGGGKAERAVLVLGGVELVIVTVFWATACRDRRRRPGFVWPDWKERRE